MRQHAYARSAPTSAGSYPPSTGSPFSAVAPLLRLRPPGGAEDHGTLERRRDLRNAVAREPAGASELHGMLASGGKVIPFFVAPQAIGVVVAVVGTMPWAWRNASHRRARVGAIAADLLRASAITRDHRRRLWLEHRWLRLLRAETWIARVVHSRVRGDGRGGVCVDFYAAGLEPRSG